MSSQDHAGPQQAFFREMRDALDAGLLPARSLNDPALYALERERLFPRVWSFIGHESEIPAPGDYALRYIGEDAFVLARDEAGEVHVFFNACRHRGTQICRAEMGNTSHFRCPYPVELEAPTLLDHDFLSALLFPPTSAEAQ